MNEVLRIVILIWRGAYCTWIKIKMKRSCNIFCAAIEIVYYLVVNAAWGFVLELCWYCALPPVGLLFLFLTFFHHTFNSLFSGYLLNFSEILFWQVIFEYQQRNNPNLGYEPEDVRLNADWSRYGRVFCIHSAVMSAFTYFSSLSLGISHQFHRSKWWDS